MVVGFKSGFVAIIGKPNVGKSTLLNSLLARKVAIVSEKPETTRENIQGILTDEGAQIVFIDTPGIHRPHLLLGRAMVKKAKASLMDADLILFMAELTSGLRDEDLLILDLINQAKKKTLAVINKIDKANKGYILPLTEEIKGYYNFVDIIPISALKYDNVELVKEKVIESLSIGEKYYPDEQLTDKDEQFQAAEIIREKVISLTRKEVPHSIAVTIERFSQRQNKDILDIDATIYVERDSQKGIVVGHNGEMVKNIGIAARQELEELFGKKIFLRLWVKVLKDWRKNPEYIKRLGLI